MSELSGGGGANGRGFAQSQRSEKRPGKRRRRRSKRRSPGMGNQPGSPGQENAGGTAFGGSPGHADDPSEKKNGQGKRRRRTRRPGARVREDKVAAIAAGEIPGSSGNRGDKTHFHSSNGKSPTNNDVSTNGIRSRQTGHEGRRQHSSIYAALDLGTNNCRLLMAVPRPRGRFRVIDGFSRIVRLGEGLSHTGSLGNEAMDRAVDALKVCATKLQNRKVKRERLIATEACRQAKNGEEFLKRVHEETGLELEIVNRETEARLAAEGCGMLMDRKCEAAVMFDIGGGSTELILVEGRRGRVRDRIVAWTSMPLGVVTIAERFGGEEVTQETYASMKAMVANEIAKFEAGHGFGEPHGPDGMHLLGTSGTVTTLAGIHLRLERYERRRVDGLWLTSGEIDEVTNELLAMDYQQRRSNPCIGSERADLVLAGCAILDAIREAWPTQRLRVADRGLREGLLTEMMNRDRVWQRPRNKNWKRKNTVRAGEQ